jgi:hypothetical protein
MPQPSPGRKQPPGRTFGNHCILLALVYDCAQHSERAREVAMQYVVGCLLFITGIVAYFPIIYIRKTNRLLKILEQIEANTRKT